MKSNHVPIKGLPNAQDDDTINRGITGQSLRDKGMYYDPATGKPTGGMDVNLNMTGEAESYSEEGMEDE